MTPLREQLQSAREDYRRVRYPGDLAKELLPPRRPARPRLGLWIGWMAGLSAAAAAMVVAMRPDLTGNTATPPAATLPPAMPARASGDGSPALLLTSFPDRLPVSLPGGPLFPATLPVNVSLSGLQADLGRLEPYSDLIRQQFQRSGITPTPAPDSLSPTPLPATRQAV